MKSHLNILLAAAVALTAAAPAFAAGEQLAASAGLSQTEAAGLGLAEIAQAKFNRDARGDATPLIVAPRTASAQGLATFARTTGLSADEARNLSLGQVAAIKFNHGKSGGDRQSVKSGGVLATRSIENPGARTQLISSAGLAPAEAAGLSLTEIAQAKFDRNTD